MSTYHNIYQENVKKKEFSEFIDNQSTLYSIWFPFYTTVHSTFTWDNLPKDILKKMPEEQLIFWGINGAFEDDGNIKIFPCFGNGELLENGLYRKYTFISKDGKTWTRDINEIELCFNNNLQMPSIFLINELSEKATYSLRSVETALQRSMIKPIVSCKDENQANMITELYDKISNLKPFAATFSDAFTNGDVNIHKFFDNKEYDVLALWDIYTRFRNMFYTSFGIRNVEIQKRERLTLAESSGNDEIVRYSLLYDMWECRKDFVERCNKKFGTDISVELNRDVQTREQIKKEVTIND